MTLLGKVDISRMTMRGVDECDRKMLKELENRVSVVPLDEQLGLDKLPFKMTVGAMLEVANWVQQAESYEVAAKMLDKYTNIDIKDDTIRYITNIIGKIVYENDLKQAEKIYNDFNTCKLPFSKEKRDGDLFIQTDGAMFHTRERDENGFTWKENKLAIVFNSNDFHRWTTQKKIINHNNVEKIVIEHHKKLGKREYTAYIGNYEILQKFLLSCAIRNGYGTYKNTILISDGAKWIKTMKDTLFYDAVHILDFYHLAENIHKFSKLIYKDNESLAKEWADDICYRMRHSKTQSVLQILDKIDERKLNYQKGDFQLKRYILDNIDCVDYALYEKNDWFIGSGAIESGNRTVLQRRLKQPGMRWNLDSAQYVVTLVAKAKSNLWEEDVVYPVLRHFGVLNIG
jgi:hypothetical protein